MPFAGLSRTIVENELFSFDVRFIHRFGHPECNSHHQLRACTLIVEDFFGLEDHFQGYPVLSELKFEF
jgi:hypothetical protein